MTEHNYQWWYSAENGLHFGDAIYLDDVPAEAPDTSAAKRIAEIDARLTSLDLASIRALAAKALDTATEEDFARLAEIEAEKAALRAERAGLVAALPVEGAES